MKVESCTAFGWVVHRVGVVAGEKFNIEVRRGADPKRLSAQTLYTKGRATGVYADNPNRAALERAPGFANDMLPNPLPALKLNMTAQEPTEWWCISRPANASLPAVSFFRLAPQQTQALPADTLIFVCEGEVLFGPTLVNGPTAVWMQNAATLAAMNAPVYAMIFDRTNA